MKASDLIVIALTIGLFGLALFMKGFSHDLLLEAGVFLVSIKLILMARKITENDNRLEEQLNQIKKLLAGHESQSEDRRDSLRS